MRARGRLVGKDLFGGLLAGFFAAPLDWALGAFATRSVHSGRRIHF